MEKLNKLRDFKEKIDKLHQQIKAIRVERDNWCETNRKEIKKLTPLKGKLYKIIDTTLLKDKRLSENEVYFFKPTVTRFQLREQFDNVWDNNCYPTVKGEIYDSNLNEVICVTGHVVEINNLVKLREGESPFIHGNRFTKIYVMLDKNTGYYKIGRSVTPKKREKTLQSEKPTIEMIYNIEGQVKDEKILHRKFKDKRIRGEWFDLSGGDLAKVKEYLESDKKGSYLEYYK